jgi:DNA-binding NarL/FixJ family response regulator
MTEDRIKRNDQMDGVADARPRSRLRAVLVVSDDENCVSASLAHMVEREFPALRVRHSASLDAACRRFENPVALVLVDAQLLGSLREGAERIVAFHPDAPIVLLQVSDRGSIDMREVMKLPSIRSVLPMNMRLDVWLAAIRLIVLGGEYYPLSFLKWFAEPQPAVEAAARQALTGGNPCPPAAQTLTCREVEILELVASGLQNKLIAARLRLSEHTVKIHLHNIINKLGVHNRTEAACIYLNCSDAFARTKRGEERASCPSLT